MRRLTAALTTTLLVTLTCCAADPAVSPSVSPPAVTTTAPRPSPSPVNAAGCGDQFDTRALLLADRWSLVVAARGASDELDMAEGFAEAAKDLNDDVKDADCDAELAVATAAVPFEIAVLIAYLSAGTESPSDTYESVAEAGNAVLDQMQMTDAQFIGPDCTGKVGDTPECTAV